MHPVMKGIVLIWYSCYLALSGYGCSNIREGLQPPHLLPQDSYAVKYYYHLEKYFYPYGQEVQIVISNPPDFEKPAGVNESYAIIDKFLNTKYTMGMEGVTYFMADYMEYLDTHNQMLDVLKDPRDFAIILRDSFLQTRPYSRWKADIRFGDPARGISPDKISAFRFLIGTRHFKTQYDQMEASQSLRDIAASLPQYNITTMYGFWYTMDQYRIIIPNTLQNIMIALVCMTFISIILIPHLLCALCVACSIVSIAFGVIGLMSLWAVDFDAIAMITMIMCVGFSVDFSAHISHGYVASKECDPNRRAREVLGALAWPVIQGAASTIFGVLVLAFVNSYVITTFFKTIFLVITIGTAHALVFLPVFLSIMIKDRSCCSRRCGKRTFPDKPEGRLAGEGQYHRPHVPVYYDNPKL